MRSSFQQSQQDGAHCAAEGKAGTGIHWSLSDTPSATDNNKVRLPLASFNHIAREVLSLERSKAFYVDILGFDVGPRPPFDSDGYWLYGYGLSLHLVLTTQPEARKLIKRDRIKYFTTCLPKVDHIAFITSDISIIRKTLDERKVYYKADTPANTGIEQLFFFDPDGNVIEVSNCAVIEQQCGAELIATATAAALAAAAAAAASSQETSLDGLSISPALRESKLPYSPLSQPMTITRSPSQVYINGADVIVSPVHVDLSQLSLDSTSSCAIPTDMQAAMNNALLAASKYPPQLQYPFSSSHEGDAGSQESGFYMFNESFNFEEEQEKDNAREAGWAGLGAATVERETVESDSSNDASRTSLPAPAPR